MRPNEALSCELLLRAGSPGMGEAAQGTGGTEPWPAWMFAGSVQTFQLGSAVAAWFRLFGARLLSASFSYFRLDMFKMMWQEQCYPHAGSCWSLALSPAPIPFPSPNLGWDLSML